MAEIAVNLAIKAAEQLLKKLVDKIVEEVKLILGVREEIQYIKDELEMMSAFLRRAEEKQHDDPRAKVWVEQVKELAYAIEDCIQEFSLHLSRDSKNLGARYTIAAEIRSIKSRVAQASERRLRYGVNNDIAPNSDEDVNAMQYDLRSAALFVEESELVGIKGSKKKLVGWLLDATPQRKLIVVVGAGGMGKTTVAKRATASPRVAGTHFECRAWITVSQTFRADDLLRDLIRQVDPSADSSNLEKITERTKLIQKLTKHLKDKRYVITLDDIWTVDAWKIFDDGLPKNALRSRVLVTTRKNEVADSCLAGIPGKKHKQKKLSPNQSRLLFCKRVFPHPYTCPADLEDSLKEILKKCDGLPLAIVTIAGALASKPQKTPNEWKNMVDHFASELQSNPNLRGVLQVLNFSYTDLPYHVRKCFLYLSNFPDHSQITCDSIERLWIAEGLVNDHYDMSPEKVAESYLSILVDRRMILPSTFNIGRKLKSFAIHDTMLEMLVMKSMEENFISLLRKNSMRLPQPQRVIRRLSIHTQSIPTDMSLSHVRSLSMFGEAQHMEMFQFNSPPAFRAMMVLNLQGHHKFYNRHLQIACKYLLHLKYLNLSGTRVTSVPHTIGNLRDLETFDIRNLSPRSLKIPSNILKLSKLRFLHGDHLEVPAKIGRLTALHDLGAVAAKKKVLMGLRNLNQLKKLKISDSSIHSKKQLRKSLNAMSNSVTSLDIFSMENLDFLLDMEGAPRQLESLELCGRLVRLPAWFSSMENLVGLCLSQMSIVLADVQTLGTLPNLLYLDLHKAYYGTELRFAARSFKSLKSLDLDIPNLSSLIFGPEALHCVEAIYFEHLKELEISGVEKLESLKRIYARGLDDTTKDSLQKAIKAHPRHPKLMTKRV